MVRARKARRLAERTEVQAAVWASPRSARRARHSTQTSSLRHYIGACGAIPRLAERRAFGSAGHPGAAVTTFRVWPRDG